MNWEILQAYWAGRDDVAKHLGFVRARLRHYLIEENRNKIEKSEGREGREGGEITVEHIETALAELRAQLNRTSIAVYFRYLVSMYRHAHKRGWYTGTNPTELLDRKPTQGPGRDTALTVDEGKRLLIALRRIDEVSYYKVALALCTGLRCGEIHGLAWDDIELDGEHATLTVRRSFRGPPKNEASAATIALKPEAVRLLRQWRSTQAPGVLYVFPNTNGDIPGRAPERFGKSLHKATACAGITKEVTPHVLRHTFGTWTFEQTGDPKLVQRLMRHASFVTSMGYVHDRRELGEVVSKLPEVTTMQLKTV
ncbi:MAG: site-specific integrase [Proteobacteria bacterium]|nr:site-specific integrase [Pseudomonadota bacterium]